MTNLFAIGQQCGGNVGRAALILKSDMNRLSFVFGFVVLLSATAAAEPPIASTMETRSIPLSEIVTTSPQKGLRHIRDTRFETNNKWDPEVFLQQIHNVSNGGSNAFIVDATNLYDALWASLDVLTGPRRVDAPVPVNRSKPERGNFWLVAYLGSGPSNPSWWTISGVTVDKSKVVLSYQESKPSPATADVRHYYYWVPLGKLEPGPYEIQLLDVDKGVVTLMRRVDVKPINARGGSR